MMNIFKAFGLKKSDEERPFVERRKKPIDQLLAPHLDEQNIPWHWAREASDDEQARMLSDQKRLDALAPYNPTDEQKLEMERVKVGKGRKPSWYHPEHDMILPWKPLNVAEEDLEEY